MERSNASPPNASNNDILNADEATLLIDNQKNSHRDDTLHHEKVHGPIDPVSALARRYIAARAVSNGNFDTLISQHGCKKHTIASHITAILRKAAIRCKISEQGFVDAHIGSHSIRASGAMALKLNGYDEYMIHKLGRWRSTTWLTYLHSQIAELMAGVSTNMARPVLFHNIAVWAV